MNADAGSHLPLKKADPLQELEDEAQGQATNWNMVFVGVLATLFAAVMLFNNFSTGQVVAILLVQSAFLFWQVDWDRRMSESKRWQKAVALLRTYAEEIKELRAVKK